MEVVPLLNLAVLLKGDGFFSTDPSCIGHIQGIDIAALDKGIQLLCGAAVLGVIEAEVPDGFHGRFAGDGVFLDNYYAAEIADELLAVVAVQFTAFPEHLIMLRREAVEVEIIEDCSVIRGQFHFEQGGGGGQHGIQVISEIGEKFVEVHSIFSCRKVFLRVS